MGEVVGEEKVFVNRSKQVKVYYKGSVFENVGAVKFAQFGGVGEDFPS